MKVCVVGLGAVGGLLAGWLGTRLPAGAVQLSALARGATLQAVTRQGLRWRDAAGDTHTVPLRASDDPAALGPQDLVVVAVKAHALTAVAPSIAALSAPHTQVLTAMNGVPWWFFHGGQPAASACAGLALHSVDPGGVIARHVPVQQVLGGVVHFSSSSPEPGVVQHAQGNGLIIGRAAQPAQAVAEGPHSETGAGADAAPLQAVAALLQQAGVAVTVSPHIQRDLWFKLWGNMTMNPVSALTGATSDQILDDPLVRPLISAVMREAQQIGAAIGVGIDQQPEERHAITRKLGSFKTSMLQDTMAGRPLEIDALLGAVREVGQHLGQPTPHLDGLLGLVRLMARQRGLYPAGGTDAAAQLPKAPAARL
jgi:2-dehydropantoate 2-reductase